LLNETGRLTLDSKIKLKPPIIREPIPFQLATEAEIISGAGGTLIVDTELYNNFFLILMKDISTGKLIKITLDNFNPQMLSWILHAYTTVGFNYYKYDLPVIWTAHKYQNLRKIRQVSDAIILHNTWPTNLQKEFDFKIHPTPHIDLIELCPGQHSLKLYMGRLHSKRIQELPFNPYTELTEEQKTVVTDYCHNDIVGTQELFLHNRERIELREALGKDFKIDLRSKSDVQMAESMIAREIYSITNRWPKKADIEREYSFKYDPPPYIKYATPQLQKLLMDVCNTEFHVESGQLYRPEIFKNYFAEIDKFKFKFGIGGLHSCEENVSYKADDEWMIVDRDVTGYYPNIIANLGLYPEQLGAVFLDVYKKMKVDREYAKKNKIFTKDKGLKIALNGVSGKLNSEYSIFYSPKCYLQMTLTGQLSVLMLAEMLQCQGMQIISANTDGLVIYCRKNDYEKLLYWIDYWEKETCFPTEETLYSYYYGRDVNAYFAVKTDGTVKVKGPYSEVGSQTGTRLDNNPITLICSDAIKLLLGKNIPIEKTIKECKDVTRFVIVRNVTGGAHKNGQYLGKVVRWIYGKNEFGTINYVKNNNKVPDSDGAIPLMDLPDQFPSDKIDYEWYIKRTVEMLTEIDYYKRSKQMTFF